MTDSTRHLIQALFHAASEIPASDRQAWVEAHAHGNQEVVSSVMALLHSARASGQGFLAEPAFKRARPALQEGMMLGPYRVLRDLGSGGMGSVYLTMRSDEVYRRLAALKVIHPALRNHPLKHRFLQEREILARLDHPNIARIIDGGTTPDGLPYFVMDYVDGLPLDEYCRKKRSTLDERLNIFRQMCQAVQYLHDNNVLHRDLKPANILVTHSGQIKLLDFGVSKLTGELSSTKTTGMPYATAGYASPEQLTSKTVTGATDIYSLGAVLYELLTGVRPLKLEDLDLQQILDTVTSQIPPKPSSQAQLPEESDPGKLLATMRSRLAGDLDCILLMALRKEPERRYASVTEFANDIERFQNRRPVIARGDGRTYRVSKTLRRHRWKIAAIVLIAASLTWGSVTTYWMLHYRSQLRTEIDNTVDKHSLLASYSTLPPSQGQAMVRDDVKEVTSEIESNSPAMFNSSFAPKALTLKLVDESLSYFKDSAALAGTDPATAAALGRGYLAVANTQWSPDHASLNDPAAAASTCTTALSSLSATKQLAQNPEVQEVAGHISELLVQSLAMHPEDSPGGQN